jgi:hypothetical protein
MTDFRCSRFSSLLFSSLDGATMPKLIENGRVVFGASQPNDFVKLLLTLKPDVQCWPLQLHHDGQLLFEAADYEDFCAKFDPDSEPVTMRIAA